MSEYNVIFETTEGNLPFQVTIPDHLPLSSVMPDLLAELRENGHMLAGDKTGQMQVLWNGSPLNQEFGLPEQGVHARDTLNVRVKSRKRKEYSVEPEAVPLVAGIPAGIQAVYVVASFLPIWTIEYLSFSTGNVWIGLLVSLLGSGLALAIWFFASSLGEPGSAAFLPFGVAFSAVLAAYIIGGAKVSAAVGWVGWLVVTPSFFLLAIAILKVRERSLLICCVGAERFSGPSFSCPRCHLACCPQHWIAQSVRCKTCEEQETPWLSLLGAQWWEDRVGPSIPLSRDVPCVRCQVPPDTPNLLREQRDLRECSQCGTLQCRWCWDLANGQCGTCDFWMPALPAAITQMGSRQGGRVRGPRG